MNLFWKVLIYIGLPFSILGTIICLCTILSRNQSVEFDYIGAIIGILSILFTVLMAWNIYTVFDYKESIRKSKHDYEDLNKRFNEINDSTSLLQIETQYALYQVYKWNNKHAGAITTLIVMLSRMMEHDLSRHNETGEIDRFIKCLKDELNTSEKYEFGEVNVKINREYIKRIRANSGYHFVKNRIESTLERIEEIINKESNQLLG